VGWVHNWFGTKYYKLLYQHRDYEEAKRFIDHLLDQLRPEPGARIVDVGCGQGRHSVYLEQKGFDVTGLDVVEDNIRQASEFENKHLHFLVHDMREPFPEKDFDLAVNLFTSFGYFPTEHEDIVSLENICNALKPDGRLIIDFMNVSQVLGKLIPEQQINVEGVCFNIKKGLRNKYVVKDIRVTDGECHYHFQENVKLLKKEDFQRYFSLSGFRIRETFGNYDLKPYDPESSDRLIMIAEKISANRHE
jgi:SAM-dependent methyltransferase